MPKRKYANRDYNILTRNYLCQLGVELIGEFCDLNEFNPPKVRVVPTIAFETCAYYRHHTITICVNRCAHPCGKVRNRNWNWPGSTTDRTPYGVLCHELGHAVDYAISPDKYAYSGTYSLDLQNETKERPITSYAPNHAEWFAEIFRLFVTNPGLLAQLRPKTYKRLREQFYPVTDKTWRECLLGDTPERVIKSLTNKGANDE